MIPQAHFPSNYHYLLSPHFVVGEYFLFNMADSGRLTYQLLPSYSAGVSIPYNTLSHWYIVYCIHAQHDQIAPASFIHSTMNITFKTQ